MFWIKYVSVSNGFNLLQRNNPFANNQPIEIQTISASYRQVFILGSCISQMQSYNTLICPGSCIKGEKKAFPLFLETILPLLNNNDTTNWERGMVSSFEQFILAFLKSLMQFLHQIVTEDTSAEGDFHISNCDNLHWEVWSRVQQMWASLLGDVKIVSSWISCYLWEYHYWDIGHFFLGWVD